MPDYYSILQLDRNATIDDVRRAYRKLAQKYHPDVSKLPDAQEKFIAITEAYEYLTRKLKLQEQNQSSSYEKQTTNREAQTIIDEWLAKERERIRSRARMHASMRFNQFRKTPYYKATETKQIQIISILAIIVGIFVIFGSILGANKVISENEKLDTISYIGASVMITIVGIILVIVGFTRLISSLKK